MQLLTEFSYTVMLIDYSTIRLLNRSANQPSGYLAARLIIRVLGYSTINPTISFLQRDETRKVRGWIP